MTIQGIPSTRRAGNRAVVLALYGNLYMCRNSWRGEEEEGYMVLRGAEYSRKITTVLPFHTIDLALNKDISGDSVILCNTSQSFRIRSAFEAYIQGMSSVRD